MKQHVKLKYKDTDLKLFMMNYSEIFASEMF